MVAAAVAAAFVAAETILKQTNVQRSSTIKLRNQIKATTVAFSIVLF